MGDSVDRKAATQAALEFIVEYLGGAFDEELQKKLMGRMNALPSAQPEQNVYVVTYQDGDEEPVLSVFNNERAAVAYRDEEGKNHDRIWLDIAPIYSKTMINGEWFGL